MMRRKRAAGVSPSSFTFLKTSPAGRFSFPLIEARRSATSGLSSVAATGANITRAAMARNRVRMGAIVRRIAERIRSQTCYGGQHMQRVIRILKVVLPITIIGFIAYLALSFDRSSNPRRNPTEPVTSTQRPGEVGILESKKFHDVQTIGGRVVMEIGADRVVGLKSGWTTLES